MFGDIEKPFAKFDTLLKITIKMKSMNSTPGWRPTNKKDIIFHPFSQYYHRCGHEYSLVRSADTCQQNSNMYMYALFAWV